MAPLLTQNAELPLQKSAILPPTIARPLTEYDSLDFNGLDGDAQLHLRLTNLLSLCKGTICKIFTVLNHKMDILCHQRLRKHVLNLIN